MGERLGAVSLIPGSEKLVSMEEHADSCEMKARPWIQEVAYKIEVIA
jgi:hypothetical protein